MVTTLEDPRRSIVSVVPFRGIADIKRRHVNASHDQLESTTRRRCLARKIPSLVLHDMQILGNEC